MFETRFLNVGGIAQLARASALQAEGHRFDSDYLHIINPIRFFSWWDIFLYFIVTWHSFCSILVYTLMIEELNALEYSLRHGLYWTKLNHKLTICKHFVGSILHFNTYTHKKKMKIVSKILFFTLNLLFLIFYKINLFF